MTQPYKLCGEYYQRINGGAWTRTPNLIVREGISHILNVALGKTPKPQGYYLALFSGAAEPADNWTAANFAKVAGEIVSMTEGYEGATRPLWNVDNTDNDGIDNMKVAASITIITSDQLSVTGAALLTHPTRGGTAGTLISATRWATPRIFQNGDIYQIGYRISLTA